MDSNLCSPNFNADKWMWVGNYVEKDIFKILEAQEKCYF